MANLGPIPVPEKLAPLLPYAKVVIAALGVIATVLLVVLGAGAPAYLYVVVSAVAALGVYAVPNAQVKAVLQDGLTAVSDVEGAYSAAKTGDVPVVEADLKKAELSANGALGGAEAIIKGIDPVLVPTPPLPPLPPKDVKPLLPSEMPTPPQPVKPKPEDEPPHPPASGVLT
jgi:hypothetical protein